jgi:hypothetical protein
MDPIMQKALEARLKDAELKITAILEALQLECQYQPEKYTLVQPPESEEESEK